MEVNVLHMAPRGLYLLFDLAGLISSHSNEALASAFFFFFKLYLFFSFSSSVHFGECVGGEMARVWPLQAVKPDGHICRRPLRPADKCSDGFLQDKERDGGRRQEGERAGIGRGRLAV